MSRITKADIGKYVTWVTGGFTSTRERRYGVIVDVGMVKMGRNQKELKVSVKAIDGKSDDLGRPGFYEIISPQSLLGEWTKSIVSAEDDKRRAENRIATLNSKRVEVEKMVADLQEMIDRYETDKSEAKHGD